MWTRRREAAISDVLSTILMLAVVVSLVAVVAMNLTAATSDPVKPVRLDFSASSDGTTLTLLHLGGDELERALVRVLVTSGANTYLDTAAGPPGPRWALGETFTLPLAAPLPPGTAEVTLVHARGETIATTAFAAPGGGGPGGGAMSVTLRLNGGTSPPTVAAPSQVLAEATIDHADGRKFVRYAYADLSDVLGPVWFGLRDDGTRGDDVAHDGTYSGVVNIPVGVSPGTHTIRVTAVDLHGVSASAQATLTVV